MTDVRRLDWENATVSLDKVSVPLDGSPDDNWLDRFYEARSLAKRTRVRGNLPHLQIELRDGTIAATEIREGELDAARALLTALVDAGNRKPSVRRYRLS